RLCLFGTGDAEIPDYDRLRVQGGDFAGTVSSVRYQIPEGLTYVLYGRSDFDAGPGGNEKLELEGSGLRKQIPNLSHSPHRFDDRVRSSRYG
ncbi:MAG: hypothetical protein GWM92_13235, partial [Gemmatimonadetes bacterium]|nr:hypothetical protein [Gemmatimonadota bacterium]NIR79668.1 hypothetical protein [Gemmatimonadota bacterium]NIT88375.1 hypothetical protein [Gemmatimonadota bacterium]NIU32186.1 hypothetical protein [Gemmatimonadota bacterium]NIU36740.1 hypothetical protein [Gemmatimonadota bacterium]